VDIGGNRIEAQRQLTRESANPVPLEKLEDEWNAFHSAEVGSEKFSFEGAPVCAARKVSLNSKIHCNSAKKT